MPNAGILTCKVRISRGSGSNSRRAKMAIFQYDNYSVSWLGCNLTVKLFQNPI